MHKLFRIVNENRLTSGMLLFLVIFYTLFALSQRSPSPEKLSQPAVQETKQTKLDELKEKENIFKKNLAEKPLVSETITLIFLLLFATAVSLDIYFLAKFIKKSPWIRSDVLHAKPRWGVKDVLQVFAFLFFAEACVASLEMLAGSFIDLKSMGHDFFLLMNSLLRDVAVAVFMIYLVKKRFREPLVDVGLTFRNFFTNLKRGFIGYIAVIPPLILSLFILALIAQFFSYEPLPQDVVQVYLKKSTDKYVLPLTLFVAGIGPVIEELFFRGFTYAALRSRLGVFSAALLTSAIFAVFHMNLMAFLPVFILGLFLTYLYEKTGSLVPSITAHMTHNFLMVCLTLAFKSLSA